MKPTRPVTAPIPPWVAEALCESYVCRRQPFRHLSGYDLPSYPEVVSLVEDIRDLLFPGFVGQRVPPADRHAYVGTRLEEIRARLRLQIYRAIHHRSVVHGGSCDDGERRADAASVHLVAHLPDMKRMLCTDVVAAMDGDPAACGPDEVVFCYPGLFATTVYRIANVLHRSGVPVIPRMMAEHAHRVTGIDIHPGAAIGESFFIDHGTGVVIGETTRIGERVRLYQGVTLGALSLSKKNTLALRGQRRHPTLEDGVIIYANATILGGDTVIGKGAVIGGNCWITRSVPAGVRVNSTDHWGAASRSGEAEVAALAHRRDESR